MMRLLGMDVPGCRSREYFFSRYTKLFIDNETIERKHHHFPFLRNVSI